jgi:hypothetical protein
MIRRVPFNQLPRSVRERLWEILSRENDPALVRFFPGGRGAPIVAAVFSLLGLGAAIVTMHWLYQEDSRKDPYFDREIYALLAGFFWFAFTVGLGLVYRALWKPPPFKWNARLLWGGYFAYVDRDTVHVLPLHGMGTPTITNVFRNGSYSGSRLNFSVGGRTILDDKFTLHFGAQGDAEKLLNELSRPRRTFEEALAAKDERALREIDPFCECTLSGQWTAPSADGPRLVEVPGVAKLLRWIGPVLLALALAAGWFGIMKSVCKSTPDCHIYD